MTSPCNLRRTSIEEKSAAAAADSDIVMQSNNNSNSSDDWIAIKSPDTAAHGHTASKIINIVSISIEKEKVNQQTAKHVLFVHFKLICVV